MLYVTAEGYYLSFLHFCNGDSSRFCKLIVDCWFFQVLQGLEAATNCVDDMDEWLGIFNVKLRHMREDIESVRTCLLKLCSCGVPGWVVRQPDGLVVPVTLVLLGKYIFV